eukprot:3457478-Pleurochrysis_carterae.AAC.2
MRAQQTTVELAPAVAGLALLSRAVSQPVGGHLRAAHEAQRLRHRQRLPGAAALATAISARTTQQKAGRPAAPSLILND